MVYYFILIPVTLIAAVLLLRIRFRAEFNADNRIIFFGLGRSGPEIDFVAGEGRIRLFNREIGKFAVKRVPTNLTEVTEVAGSIKRDAIRREKKAGQAWSIMKRSLRPLYNFIVSLFKATVIEEMNAEIAGGFDDPCLTGSTYGYYQAAVGAVPALAGRLNYYPDWMGASLSGSFKVSVALPLYRLVGSFIRLLWQLPLREMTKLAIGRKKGTSDGK
jgi:hypothetical protein